MKKPVALAIFTALVLASLPAHARPLTPAEQRDSNYSGLLPFCDHPSVLSKIDSEFNKREREFWSSGLGIVGFQQMQEIGYRATGVDYMPRRYCRALVFMSDQKVRAVNYSIGERDSGIGFSWGAEWCISGLDRNYAFGLDCRSARP